MKFEKYSNLIGEAIYLINNFSYGLSDQSEPIYPKFGSLVPRGARQGPIIQSQPSKYLRHKPLTALRPVAKLQTGDPRKDVARW